MEVSGLLHVPVALSAKNESHICTNLFKGSVRKDQYAFGEEKNILCIPGFKHRTVQPVV
jgi:hypothetical protein